MEFLNLKINKEDDHFLVITINRPQALNALNKGVMDELHHVFFKTIPNDSSIHGVILIGEGNKAFVAGADITEFGDLHIDEAKALSLRGKSIFDKIENTTIPVIACIEGFALGGGCELAMACHMRIASTKAKFGQPEVNLGLLPGYSATQRLPKLIGKGKAMELLLTADMINGEEATRLGLSNHLVEPGETRSKALSILKKIATKGPNAVAFTIECVNRGPSAEADALESDLFGKAIVSEEGKEGANSFLSKRKPNFKR